MKLATTTDDFKGYSKNHCDMVKYANAAGFKYLDLGLYNTDIPGSPFMADNWREYVRDIKECAERVGAKFVQAHSPGSRGNVLIKNEHYDLFVESTARSIEICGMLGIKNTVIHTGFLEGVGKDEYFEKNAAFIKQFIPLLEKHGVTICVENSTKVNMGTKYFFLEGCEMKEFIEYCGHPLIGACWDTGHANLEGHQYKDITELGAHLKALHIHDTTNYDSHSLPFTGTMNLAEVIHALMDSGYDGYFTFEACCAMTNPVNNPGYRKVFAGDDRLYIPPLELRIEMEKLLYKIGEFALSTYGIFEE